MLWPREAVYEMIGFWRIKQRKPEQHREQHPGRPEHMGELASHVANIRREGLNNLKKKSLGFQGRIALIPVISQKSTNAG